MPQSCESGEVTIACHVLAAVLDGKCRVVASATSFPRAFASTQRSANILQLAAPWVMGPSRFAVSDDGVTFEPVELPDNPDITKVVATDAGFAAIDYRSAVWLSADGRQWRKAGTALAEGNLFAFVNGKLVAGGSDGALSWSEDGKQWLTPTQRVPVQVDHLLFSNGQYVAAGNGVSVSSDGLAWSSAEGNEPVHFEGVAFGAGRFTAVGSEGKIYTSESGRNWQRVPSGTDSRLFGVAFGKGRFVVAVQRNAALTSETGLDWTLHPLPEPPEGEKADMRGIAFGGGLFVMGGEDGRVAVSSDGVTWQVRPTETRTSLKAMTFHQGRFYSATNVNFEHYLTSSDVGAQTWTTEKVEWDAVYAIASNGKKLVVPGHCGSVQVSPDGSRWTAAQRLPASASDLFWNGFTALGETFYLMTPGVFSHSADGIHYERDFTGWRGDLNAMAEGNGVRVAVGEAGVVMTQP